MAEPLDPLRRTAPRTPGARPPEVHALIDSARRHALGLEFLRNGAHDAVAATFGVHAFLVDAARDHLRSGGTGPAGPR